MSCNVNDVGSQHLEMLSPQDPGLTSDLLTITKASLKAESVLGQATNALTAIEPPLSGDGDHAQSLSRNLSNSCSSNADDHLEFEAISNTLPSEVSPTSFGKGSGKSMEMILSSHATNTAANTSIGLQAKHVPNPPDALFESPWGADCPWGIYKVPEEFNEQGRMTRWTEVIVQKVKPYIEEVRRDLHGGSGILDTDDPTHYYLMMPLGSLDLPPEVPEVMQEQRRMYSGATRIEPLGAHEHTGMTDNESSSGSGEESSSEEEVESSSGNDSHTEPIEAAIVPMVATFGGLWNPVGTRDVRESRYSPKVISSCVCTDCETGSVISWTSDECDPDRADTPARSVPQNHQATCDTNVRALQAPNSLQQSQGESNPELEDFQAHSFFTKFKDEQKAEVEETHTSNFRNRVLVTTSDGGTVRIDLPRVIVTSYPGKPPKELPFSVANLSNACWEIIKSHGIADVRVIGVDENKSSKPNPRTIARQRRSGLSFDDSTSSLPVFNSVWIQANATWAMKRDFPSLEYYLDIQSACEQSSGALPLEHISFFYHHLSDLPAHYLLNKPLAPPNTTLEEQMADGTLVSIDESNLTVPQFIKRLYTDAKLEEEQTQLLPWSQLDPCILMLSISSPPIKDAAAMVDDWPVEEAVLVPKTFDHSTAYFDLQQINWVGNVGYHPSYVRQKRDEGYVEYRNTDKQITHVRPSEGCPEIRL